MSPHHPTPSRSFPFLSSTSSTSSPLAAIAPALGALALAIALLPGTAKALDIQSVDRLVNAFGVSMCPGCGPNGEDTSFANSESIPSMALGIFDESASSLGSDSQQNSDVNSSMISGTGYVSSGGSVSNSARSRMTVTFTVPTAQTIQITGGVNSDCCSAIDEHRVRFSSPTMVTTLASFGNTVFDQLFNLEPGTLYTLETDVITFDSSGGAGWSVSLVAIPEPGTATLFALGLGLLARRRAN